MTDEQPDTSVAHYEKTALELNVDVFLLPADLQRLQDGAPVVLRVESLPDSDPDDPVVNVALRRFGE